MSEQTTAYYTVVYRVTGPKKAHDTVVLRRSVQRFCVNSLRDAAVNQTAGREPLFVPSHHPRFSLVSNSKSVPISVARSAARRLLTA